MLELVLLPVVGEGAGQFLLAASLVGAGAHAHDHVVVGAVIANLWGDEENSGNISTYCEKVKL